MRPCLQKGPIYTWCPAQSSQAGYPGTMRMYTWRQCEQTQNSMGSPSTIVSALKAETRRRGMLSWWPCSAVQRSPWPFVRYYTTAAPLPAVRGPIAGVLARLGVIHLAWEKVNSAPSYGVIELSSIIKRECIVPAWSETAVVARAQSG